MQDIVCIYCRSSFLIEAPIECSDLFPICRENDEQGGCGLNAARKRKSLRGVWVRRLFAYAARHSGWSYVPEQKKDDMSRALSRDKFGQTPCFSGPGLIIWPASLPRWTCLDRRASSQSNIRGFAGRAAAASDRRGSPPRALYVAGVASQFVATAGGVTFGLKSLPAGVPREQRPRE